MVEIRIEERLPEFPREFWGEIVNVSVYSGGRFPGRESIDIAVRADKPSYRNLQHIFLPYEGIEFSKDGKEIRINPLTYSGLFYKRLLDLGWRPKGNPRNHLELARELIGLKGRFRRIDLKTIDPRMRTRSEKWLVEELGEPR